MKIMNPDGPVWISAGEASGDLHGAMLARELLAREPSLSIMGMGGPAMEAAGCDVRYPMSLISLVGFTEVFAGLPRILKLLGELKADFGRERPRAIILLDCPDFHFRVAKMARKMGIPVYYYISPQIWAWRSGRANFLRENVRNVFCILPFEKDFYAKYDMDVDYIGNPLVDEVPLERLDAIDPEPNLVGILPGSRNREISTLLPEFTEAARVLRKRNPDTRFALFRAPGMDASNLWRFWGDDLPAEIVEPEDRYEGMRRCSFVMAASGTVSLELALCGTPAIIAYRLSSLSYFIGRFIINVDFISLPNLILKREVFPEMIQEDARALPIAQKALSWRENPEELAAIRSDLAQLRTMLGEPGAAGRAADLILEDLKEYRHG